MQTRSIYAGSYLYRIVSALFLDKIYYPVEKSRIGRVLQKIYLPYVTEAGLVLSVIIFWYEGFFARYIPFLPKVYLASILIMVALTFSNKKNISFGKSHFWLLGFLVVSLVSATFSISRGVEISLLISGWMIFFQFGAVIVATQSIKRSLSKVLVWMSLPLSLTGLYQFIFHVETPPFWLSPSEKSIDTRAFAFFGSPNILGILLAIMVLVTIGLYIKSKNRWYLVPILLDILVTGLTFSRSAWMGLVVGLVFMVALYRPRLMLWSPTVVLLLLIPQFRNRISVIFSDKYLIDSSLDGRVWSFINGIYLFKKYFFFGTGPGSYGGTLAARSASPVYLESIQRGYTALYFTDNQFLEILVQTGLLGFMAFTGFLVSVFWHIVDKLRKKRDIMVLASGASFTCFLVSGLFANVLEFGAIAIPMGIIIGSVLDEK